MRLFLIFAALIFISSCSIYNDHQSIKDMKWFKSDVKTFEVNIPEKGNYDLFFTMRHSTGYPYTTIKVMIEQITPEGKILNKEAEFFVADEKGNYTGEVTGQLWDLEKLFSKKTPLKKGKYTFNISHAMNNNPVILVIDVGLKIKKTE